MPVCPAYRLPAVAGRQAQAAKNLLPLCHSEEFTCRRQAHPQKNYG